MARSNKTIPVYSVSAHIGHDKPLYHVTFWRAIEMLKETNHEGKPIFKDTTMWVHGKGRAMPILKYRDAVRKEEDSPASLTASDSRAAAGLSSPAHNRYVTRKLQLWPEIGDTKAIRVCPA